MSQQEEQQQQQSLSESERYSRRSILRSEKIYGKGFQSPGGLLTTAKFSATLDVAKQSGLKVLDLGSGLGGAALHMAEKYGATVVGVDYSQNMVDICNERLQQQQQQQEENSESSNNDSSNNSNNNTENNNISSTGNKKKLSVSFQQGDASNGDMFAPESFDLIWTRDTVLYLEDQQKVWSNCYKWLKKGGQLMVTDFGKKGSDEGQVSDQFKHYYTSCHYYLHSLQEYKSHIEGAGFTIEEALDISELFNELNHKDLIYLSTNRDQFLADFTESELKHLEERWHKKIDYTSSGDMKWLKFVARKN